MRRGWRSRRSPLGHIFREGHRIRIQIHTPPAVEGLWGYTPRHEPAAGTVHHDADRPSRMLQPVVEPDGTTTPEPEGCGVPGGFPCVEHSPLNEVTTGTVDEGTGGE